MSDDESVTKPTFEMVPERIAALSAELIAFRESVDARFDRIEMKFHVLSEDILALRADMRLIEQKIEARLKPR